MENKTDTKRERLKALFIKYELDKEDIFTMKMGGRSIPIVTRTGIEKIMSKEDIELDYEVVKCEEEFAAIYCTAKKTIKEVKGDGISVNKYVMMKTFGSASPKNCKSSYYLEMAEKRSKARAVLLITEFYSLGVYSEVESDDFKQENNL